MAAPLLLVKILKKAFPYRRSLARLTRFKPVAAALDKTLFNGDDLVYVPKDRVVIQQAIEQPGSVALPSSVVDHFIEKASYHWIMNECICREGDDCQDYPHDIGCIFLGEAVMQINPKLGRLVSKDEALAHARRARELGLVQLIGRDRLDNLWMGAGPFGKLMTICNCCPCCCLFRVLPDLDRHNSSKVARMEGVRVWVDTDACAGCGKCSRGTCFVEAIEMADGHARITEGCRGCGRCVEVCPRGAIHLTISDPAAAARTIAHLSTLVDLGPSQASPRARERRETGDQTAD